MIQDSAKFVCPKDYCRLQWPEALCQRCDRSYHLTFVSNLNGAERSRFHLYDFRPLTSDIEMDRQDLDAHRKVVEGLLCFEGRKLRQLGFEDLHSGIKVWEGSNSRLLAYGLYCERTLRNVMEWFWHALSGKHTKKVAANDSIQSSFAGYSRSYEMISDFVKPNWLGWHEGQLKCVPVLLHHYKNMLVLGSYIKKWGCKNILEFGCGTGINLLLLKRVCPSGDELSVSGFDYAVSRILTTRATMEHFGLECRNVFLANGLSLPLEDESFDMVFSHYVIEQMAGYEEAALDSMLRVARIGVVLFETALYKPTLNQRIYMKHSGYSQRLPEVIRQRSDVVIEEMMNNKQDCFFGAPNVLVAVRKKDGCR